MLLNPAGCRKCFIVWQCSQNLRMLQNPKRLQSTILSILCSLYPSRLLQCPESFHQIIHITTNEPWRGFRWLCHLKVDLHWMPSNFVGISINTHKSVKTAKLLCNSLSKVSSDKFVLFLLVVQSGHSGSFPSQSISNFLCMIDVISIICENISRVPICYIYG